MRIRKLLGKDLGAMHKLGLQEFKGQFWFTRKFLAQTMSTPGLFYGAFDGKKMIGTIMVKVYDKPKAWVYYFVVDKNYRRKGVGSALLAAAVRALPKGNYLLIVDIGEKDALAKSFYGKQGFKRAAKIKEWFGPREAGLLYCRKFPFKR
jgi:ribosomal protein S18 acetylase RimI-like enzyme